MNTLNIKESCVCGAWFEVSASFVDDAKEQAALWREEHRAHGSKFRASLIDAIGKLVVERDAELLKRLARGPGEE